MADSNYAVLKARAKELGIRTVGVRADALAAAIDAEEQRLAAEAPPSPEAVTADVAADEEQADEQAPEPISGKRRKAVPIVRQDRIRWWCPVDDFSMPTYMKGCAKCGARREGDTVIPA
jgi:hypothetical protein